MRWAIGMLLVGAIGSGANAQGWFNRGGTIDRIEIVGFGTYAVTVVPGTVRRPPDVAGNHTGIADFHRIDGKDVICANIGTTFGVEIKVHGRPDGQSVNIEYLTHFPPPGVTNAEGRHYLHNRYASQIEIGDVHFRAFTFEEPWELAVGKWRLETRYKGRSLSEKSFEVIRCSPIS